MTRERDERMALLAAILDSQVERIPPGAIDEQRLVEALTTGPEFTAQERQLLWFSPAARNAYFAVKHRVVRELEERLQEERIVLQLFPRVAGGGADVVTVEGGDFTVVVQDYLDEAGIWVVSLRLKQRSQTLIPPMTVLRLVDSGGLEWLSGRPDRLGEINATWKHEDVSPRERLVYSLEITPR